jgi:hypothetical protein
MEKQVAKASKEQSTVVASRHFHCTLSKGHQSNKKKIQSGKGGTREWQVNMKCGLSTQQPTARHDTV